jgi:RNA polymerase sigma factor (sigma-70 family)
MDGQTMVGSLPGRVVKESPARISALFDAHYERLYRLARRLTSNADDALDLVQDTFLRAAGASFIPDGSTAEEAWLVRVLVNLRRDEWRKAMNRQHHEPKTGLLPLPMSDPEAQAVARTMVWQALDALHPRRRAVLVLHELEGMNAVGIAALLGISAVTVRWHLSRGRRELTRILAPATGEAR